MICYILLAIVVGISFYAFIKCVALAIASYCVKKEKDNKDE